MRVNLMENVLVAIFLISWFGAIATAGLFIANVKGIQSNLDSEVFKLTYQFLTVVVVGGGLSALYKLFTVQRARAQEREALLRRLHSELLDAYNVAKRVRRKLRAYFGYDSDAKAFHPDAHLTAVQYSEQLATLTGAQLTFESYAIRAEDKQLGFKTSNELEVHLRSVEKYLNKIIDEYALKLQSFQGTPPAMQLSELPKLRGFIDSRQESPEFQHEFQGAMKSVRAGLVQV